MGTWITLTDADVRITTFERTAIDSRTPAQSLAACVVSASNLARGYIGARNPMADAPQVPPEVKDAVLAIALADYLAQVPGHGLLDDARKTARDNALKLLKDIALGNFMITQADVEEAVQPVTPSPGITVPARNFQPACQDGI